MAKHWTNVNDKRIVEALKFLKSEQNSDGKFKEYGKVSYAKIQTNSSEGIPLTAFTLIAFLESNDYKDDYKEVIDKSLTYIDQKINSIDDSYTLAIASYALALGGKTESAKNVLEKLKNKAFAERGKRMFWTASSKETTIEIAAYAILAHVKLGLSEQAIPIVNSLVSKRNPEGGFYSSHDTVIGIQALAEIAKDLHTDKHNMTIKLSPDGHKELFLKMNNENRLVLQERKLSPSVRGLSFNVIGHGVASLQVSYSYNTKRLKTDKSFMLTITEIPNSEPNTLLLKICASNLKNSTGMAIIEVGLPSGYVFDHDFDLLEVETVQVKIID